MADKVTALAIADEEQRGRLLVIEKAFDKFQAAQTDHQHRDADSSLQLARLQTQIATCREPRP